MKTFADGARAIEIAVTKARSAGRPVRYGYFLRSLPDFLLSAMANSGTGDTVAASLTILATLRVGWLLDNCKRAAFEPANDVLTVAATRVYEDALVEVVRRGGYLEKFDPAATPFADGPRRIRLSDKGREATGDVRVVMDNLCANCEVI